MKKVLLICAALLSCIGTTKAVRIVPKSGYSNLVHLGMSVSSFRGNDSNPKVGLDFGWRGEYMLPGAKGAFVNFGVDLQQKGGKWDVWFEEHDHMGDYKQNAFYFSIPIHAGYRYDIQKNWGIYADFGPFIAVGFAGNHNWFGNDKYDARRFDVGLGFRLGTELNNRLSFNLGFDWGLIDYRRPENISCYTFCNTISLAYRF